MSIKKIASFFHLIDLDDTLNLADVAFIVVMVKIIKEPNVDWPSMVTLLTVSLNMMHQRHVNAGDIGPLQDSIREQTSTIKTVIEKVSPVIEAVKGELK